ESRHRGYGVDRAQRLGPTARPRALEGGRLRAAPREADRAPGHRGGAENARRGTLTYGPLVAEHRGRQLVRALRFALRRFFAIVLLAQLVILASPVEGQRVVEPQRAAYSADDVKAAFLYRFATYVEWPVVKAAGDPITIAVLGAPSIAMLLSDY